MKCSQCAKEHEEHEIQLSHDVPRYIGGLDSDGRRYLCTKCHDIYERLVMAVMCRDLPEYIKQQMRARAKSFSERYFKEVHGDRAETSG